MNEDAMMTEPELNAGISKAKSCAGGYFLLCR